MPRQSEAAIPTMDTEASKSRSLELAFVLNGEDVRRLESLLKEIGDSIEYQVKFSDGHALQYHSADEILKLSNSSARCIVSFIAGVKGRAKQSAYVVLKERITQSSGGNSQSPTIEYTINGTQKDVIYFGDKLDEWTLSVRQWYSAFYHGFLAVLLFLAVVLAPIFLWGSLAPRIFSDAFLKFHSWLQGATVVALWVGEYWLFKLFPRATFAIGAGVRRHEFFRFLRTSILAGFILSVLASLFANWLSANTTK